MSGPVDRADAPPDAATSAPEPPTAEIADARESVVGDMTVRRSLPKARRRTVGAWCFVDHFGPLAVEPDGGMDIGPHPHTGLSTVTYLLDGEVLHRDSVGSEQVIRPGQLNLMTAGRGLSHAEEPTGHYRGTLHGVQLWVAQPEATRPGRRPSSTTASCPRWPWTGPTPPSSWASSRARVACTCGHLAPRRGDRARPRRHELSRSTSRTSTSLVVLDGVLVLDDAARAAAGRAPTSGSGRAEVVLTAPDGARVLLLGGEPFPEPVVMWWNFVGRTKDEVAEARAQWERGDDRFGRVATSLARIPAPPLRP